MVSSSTGQFLDPSPGNPGAVLAGTEQVAKGWNDAVRAFLVDPDPFPRLVFPFVEWRPVVKDDEFALTLSNHRQVRPLAI